MRFIFTVKSVLPSAAIAVLGLVLGSTSVYAATATTTFQVTANVQATCVLSATTATFGTYTGTADKTTTAIISVACSNSTIYNLGLSAGLGTGATVAIRKMTGANAALLNYGLFQDAAFSTNWGNTVGTDTVTGTSAGAVQYHTVYGRIPAGQFSDPGEYTDTITATITY